MKTNPSLSHAREVREANNLGFGVRRVNPRDFGGKGRAFWVVVPPTGAVSDAYATRHDATHAMLSACNAYRARLERADDEFDARSIACAQSNARRAR